MSCIGVLFSLSEKEIKKIKSFNLDEDRLEYLQEEIEKTYFDEFPDRMAVLDKSWDALHRSLTDGKLEWENGDFPLNHVILAGEFLYSQDNYIMSLKTPKQVIQISDVIEKINKDDLLKGYNQIDADDYMELSSEDFEYTWDNFNSSKEFWMKASEEKRYVLFTVDP